jgi:Xaa-Pro aminopeptidase
MKTPALILFLCAGALTAQIPAAEYAARRARVLAAHADGLVLVPSRADAPQTSEGGFRQLANFYYLTGSDAFRAVLALDGPKKESWLFLSLRPEAALPAAPNGIEHVARREELPAWMARRWKERVRKFYEVSRGPRDVSAALLREEIKAVAPKAQWASAAATLDDLRWIKSPAEIALLRRAAITSAAALRAAMRGVRAGRTQREIEPEVIASCVQNGAEGQSFWPWVMSGPNSVFPAPPRGWYDYRFLNRTMRPGETVYLDLGCHYERYEGDLGRTVPVSGKFTPEQREVYELLLRGFQAVRAAIKPGVTVAALKKTYYGVMREAQNLVQSDLARTAVALEIKEGDANTMFLVHGVGLDPVEKEDGTLAPGVVLAIEPMIMLPEQNLGFQIEDMVVVTETGSELLSAGLPYTASEVEAFLASKARAAYPVSDAHNHVGPGQRTAEQLIPLMNILGMHKSVIFGGGSNDYVLEIAAQHPDRLIPFYRASVREEQDAWLANDPKILAELERQLSSGKWRGIGEFGNVHYPPGRKAQMFEQLLDTEVSPLHPMVVAMFRLADRYHLPVLMHNEVYYYKEMDQLLGQFPRVKVIWAHAGYTSYYGVEMLMKKRPNLFADLSIRARYSPRDSREASIFYDQERVKALWLELIEKYPDRFVVGLDELSPGYRNYEENVAWMYKILAQLTPATARKVAWENLEAIVAARP